ncbi:MAG: hypothetical protein K6F17_00150 [Lachnospiraceae bacterium]|nr:hypothetical protein [Lachnospiraceae bacterium]
MGIKDELQGPNGYLKRIRTEYMPDTKKMAGLAYEKYSIQNQEKLNKEYLSQNADDVLRGLFLAETEIFDEKNSEIMSRLLPYYYNYIYQKADKNYIETSEKLEKLLDTYKLSTENKCSFEMFIQNISDVVVPIVEIASFSQKQSAKTRVGETLQNHLSKIFNICGIKYETQQQKDEGGTIMDFVIPSLAAIDEMPDQVINIECQTTLKDRFRLTTGKSTDGKIKRYLATVTGAGIVTQRDRKDFTVNKVKEIIVDNNVTLVVLKEVKAHIVEMFEESEKALKAGKTYKNASVTLEEIERLNKLCKKKVISYSELISRDIKSTLVYWN